MRLIHLRFANLNSLVGEWSVDFTHPDYLANGIFAITGPTGSGKTTLLDAICLALFGCTPRLSRITKAANDIMARHTGECFAEVVFETLDGRYRVHWSQHRARRKPQGELQAPKHELADAHSGKLIDTRVRNVADQVERLIGMDFERFTRSVLLAQGAFTAFLQATANERAPILEQITGTELYSQISIHVHELRQQERTHLQRLETELANVQILEPAAVSELEQRRQQRERESRVLADQLRELDQARQWLDQIAQLRNEVQESCLAQQTLKHEVEQFEPERRRLACAQQALEVSAIHAALTALREEHTRGTQNLAQLHTQQERLNPQVLNAERELAQCRQQLTVAQQQRQIRVPLLRQVTELDRQILSLQGPLEQARQTAFDNDTRVTQYQSTRETLQSRLEKQQAAQQQLLSWQADNANDAQLATELRMLQERWDNLQAQRRGANDIRKAGHEAQQKLEQAGKLQQDHEARCTELKARIFTLAAQIQQKKNERSAILESGSTTELLDRETKLVARYEGLKQLEQWALAVRAMQEQCHSTRQQADQARVSLNDLKHTIHVGEQELHAATREFELLQEQQRLHERISSLENLRDQLRAGQPCPLCGSVEHPFSGHIPSADSATHEQLNRARQRQQQATQALQNLHLKQAGLERDLQHAIGQYDQLHQQLTQLQQSAPPLASSTEAMANAPDLAAYASRELTTTGAELERLRARARKLRTVDDELEHAVAAHSQLGATLARADAVERDAREQQALCRQTVDRLHEQLDQAEHQVQTTLNTLLVDVNGYRTDPCCVQTLPQALSELKDRRDIWVTKTSELDAFARELPALQAELRHIVQQLEQTTQARDAANKHLVDLQAQHASLRDQRNTLYGDGLPDEEEKQLARTIELLQQGQEQLLATHSALTARKDSLAKQVVELRATLSQQQAQLDETRNRFNQALEQRGLSDEQSYLQACLEPREREALQVRSGQLEQRQAALRAHHTQTLAKLDALQGKQLWRHTEQELDQRRTHTQQLIQAAMQELGAINQQLAAHTQQLSEQRDKLLALQQHQEVCRQWDKLHELIGSADGKKYRNFAQGLTFDVMIGYANRQLAKMSDRYLLVRDTTQMLDLNVIDNHQGAQVRPTRNLSGGESFLVSLALALGLSSMSSRNVRVDSLFLDEGFGTLDEDALDTALETLSGLHQEGKLIGVISHIPALKDRIGIQIQVTPVSGGCSRLSGPGCTGPG